MLLSDRSKKSRRGIYALLVFALLVVAAGVTYLGMKFQTAATISSPIIPIQRVLNKEQSIINYGLPARLKIPKIGVDAFVTSVGTTKDGDMESPLNIHDTGWYSPGARPGNEGSAVIAGHLDGPGNKKGVFFALNKLQKGDMVSVIDDQGNSVAFTVRETRTYGLDEQPSEVFVSTQGAHLNLITCAGGWDKTRKSYSKRLVVFTDRVN